MITTTRSARRATTQTAKPDTQGRGVPQRALADGVLERRRVPRRRNEPSVAAPAAPTMPARGELLPQLLSPTEHYRVEIERRGGRVGVGDLASLLAEAKAEYEAMLAAPRPAGKGGRPKKKPSPKPDEIELADEDALGDD